MLAANLASLHDANHEELSRRPPWAMAGARPCWVLCWCSSSNVMSPVTGSTDQNILRNLYLTSYVLETNAWRCTRETRLIVSLMKDTACCDQATESVWVWLSGVTADNPAISHKPWSEVYRYHRVHAAITSCLWNASFSYKARSAHPWQVYMGSNLSRKQSSSLQCSALLMSPAIARQLECLLHHWHYTIFYLLLHWNDLSRQLMLCCKCDWWNCWSLQNC